MTALTPRDRRRQANLRRIVDEALHIVQREGIDALSVARLADAVDYTPGALYRYFPSKDALIAHLGVEVLEGLTVELAEAAQIDPLARLWAQAGAYRAFSAASPHGFGLLTAMLADPRRLVSDDAAVAPMMGAFLAALAPTAEACAAAAAARAVGPGDPMERALVLFATLQGVLQLRKQSSRLTEGLPIDRLAGDAVRAVLVGWGAAVDHVATTRAVFDDGIAPTGGST